MPVMMLTSLKTLEIRKRERRRIERRMKRERKRSGVIMSQGVLEGERNNRLAKTVEKNVQKSGKIAIHERAAQTDH